MMIFSRRILGLALGITLTSAAFAGTWPYTAKPGVQEFTGQLIVRPIQVDTMLSKNWTLDKIRGLQSRVAPRFAKNLVRYYSQTDEYVVKVPAGKTDNSYAKELIDTGDFQYVCPNWRLYPTRNPNDPQYPQQWHHPKIKSNLAWNLWTGSSQQYISFVDTGVTKNHEDLHDLLVPGYNSVDRKTEAEGGDINDINGHGTHVAGCGAAHGNNGIGVSGVGWNFKIRFVRTSNSPSGGASLDDILAGARWAVDNGSRTISASYSGVDNDPVGTTGTYVKSKGGLFFYAAGNDNRDLNMFSYADTIVCGASDENDGKAGFSAYGKGVALFSPGTNILSSTIDGGYGYASGTSMATPITNGAMALIWSANPSLTPDEAQQILYLSCDAIGSSNVFGHGRTNVYKGVQMAMATLAKDTTITSVGVQTGDYTAGNLGSVQDSDLNNAYVLNTVNAGASGTIGAATMTCSLPTDQGTITSFGLSTTFRVSGGRPSSVFAYLLNRNTNKYDLITTKGALPDTNTILSFKLGADATNYVFGDGSVRILVRSVVPQRFGPASGTLSIGYAKGRYSTRPSF